MTSTERVTSLMGGRDIFGDAAGDRLRVADRIEAGLPYRAVEALLRSSLLTLREIERVGLPRRTLSHRRRLGSLGPDQSDRLFRLARIYAEAVDTFASPEKAIRWLRRPTRVLSQRAPLDLLATDEGSRVVEGLLGRIAHGIAA